LTIAGANRACIVTLNPGGHPEHFERLHVRSDGRDSGVGDGDELRGVGGHDGVRHDDECVGV
jgi:hypothetical protein